MAQIASGYKVLKHCFEKVIGERQISKMDAEVLVIDEIHSSDWRKQLIDYLQNPSSNYDKKLKFRALHYTTLGVELYKKSIKGPLLRCLDENDAYLALAETHEGICGAHQT